MKKILIMCTTNRIVVGNIIDSYKQDTVYLLIPESQLDYWKKEKPKLNCITTEPDYMDYNVLKKENKLVEMYFDTIIIPSSTTNIFSFGDVIAFVSDLKAKEVIWKDSCCEKQLLKGLKGSYITKTGALYYFIFYLGYWSEKIISFLLGRIY